MKSGNMATTTFTAINYPESDGKPMGETDLHRDAMVRHIELLKRFFQDQLVYVSGDLLVYYEQGNPRKFVVPDAFVVKGLKQVRRRTFRIWNERIPPHFVLETTSKKTKNKDLKDKPSIYASIGVREYFLFDPTSDYLDPPLQGNRLVNGVYCRINPEVDGALVSTELGLKLALVSDELEFFRIDTGERLLTAEESRQQEALARQKETDARQAAEAENVRLRELIRMLQEKNDNSM